MIRVRGNRIDGMTRMTTRYIEGDFSWTCVKRMETTLCASDVISPDCEYTYCQHDTNARWTPVRQSLCTRTKVGMTVAEVKKIFRADLAGTHFTPYQVETRVGGYAVRKISKSK